MGKNGETGFYGERETGSLTVANCNTSAHPVSRHRQKTFFFTIPVSAYNCH